MTRSEYSLAPAPQMWRFVSDCKPNTTGFRTCWSKDPTNTFNTSSSLLVTCDWFWSFFCSIFCYFADWKWKKENPSLACFKMIQNIMLWVIMCVSCSFPSKIFTLLRSKKKKSFKLVKKTFHIFRENLWTENCRDAGWLVRDQFWGLDMGPGAPASPPPLRPSLSSLCHLSLLRWEEDVGHVALLAHILSYLLVVVFLICFYL